jgi:hypothetical protein
MLIFDLFLYVTQCYTDCNSYLYLSIFCNIVVYFIFLCNKEADVSIFYIMENNVNCPDTVGIL